MGKVGKRLAIIIGVPFGVSIVLFAGSMVMNQVCVGNIQDEWWREELNELCLRFPQSVNFIEEYLTKK